MEPVPPRPAGEGLWPPTPRRLPVLQSLMDPSIPLDASSRDHLLQVRHPLLESTMANVVISSFLLITAEPPSPFAALPAPFGASSSPLPLIVPVQLFISPLPRLASASASSLPCASPFQSVPSPLSVASPLLRPHARLAPQLQQPQLLHHPLALEAARLAPRPRPRHQAAQPRTAQYQHPTSPPGTSTEATYSSSLPAGRPEPYWA